jgi:hypothetical protein
MIPQDPPGHEVDNTVPSLLGERCQVKDGGEDRVVTADDHRQPA